MAVIDSLLVELGFKADDKKAKKFGKSVDDVKKSFSGLSKVVLGVSGGLFLLGRGFAETSEKISLSAKRAGLTTKSFQELAGAAQIAGINQDAFTTSLQQFNVVLGQARLGRGQGIQALGLLGLSLNKANGEAKTTSSLLLEVSNRLKDLPKSERISVAQDLGFTAESLSVLQLGGKELKKLEAQFQATGDVISKEGIEKGVQYNETMKLLEDNIGGVKKAIEIGLLPSITKMTDGFQGWFKANQKVITQNVIKFIKAAGLIVGAFFKSLKDLGTVLNSLLRPVGGLASALGVLFAILAVGKILKIVGAFFKFVKALKEVRTAILAIDIASLLNPVGLVIGAIAILGAGVLLLMGDFKTMREGGVSEIGKLEKKFPEITGAVKTLGKALKVIKITFEVLFLPIRMTFDLILAGVHRSSNAFTKLKDDIKGVEKFIDKAFGKIKEFEGKADRVLGKLPFVGSDFKNTQKVQSTQFVSLLGSIKPSGPGQSLVNTNKVDNTKASSVVNATINISDSPDSQRTAKAVMDILNNNSRQAQRNLANPVRG